MKKQHFLMSMLSLSISAVTYADEDASSKVHQLSPIIVIGVDQLGEYTVDENANATGMEIALQDTPQSISVVTQQQMRDQNLFTVDKVLDNVIGVSKISQGNNPDTSYTYYYARGLEITNFVVDGTPMDVVGFSGGQYATQGIANLNTLAYDNITVIKGADGLMTGTGNPSATINLNRKRPQATPFGQATLGAGSWNRYNAEFDVTGALNQDRSLRGRFTAAYTNDDTQQEDANNRNLAIYAIAEYDLTDKTLLSTGIEYQKVDDEGSSAIAADRQNALDEPTYFDYKDNNSAPWAKLDLERWNIFANIEHQFDNDWKTKFEYNYYQTERNQDIGAYATTVYADNSSTMFSSDTLYRPKMHTLNWVLNGDYDLFGQNHEFSVGASYNHTKNHYRDAGWWADYPIENIYDVDRSSLPYPKPSADLYAMTRYDIENVGAFLSTRMNLTDQFHVIAGGRFNDYRYKYQDSSSQVNKEDDRFTPYFGLVYDLNDDLSAYASWTEVYNPQANMKDVNDHDISTPMEGINQEIGLKSTLFDGRLTANLAHYRVEQNDVGFQVWAPDWSSSYYDLVDREGYGWEAELNGRINDDWQLHAGYSYTKLDYDSQDTRNYDKFQPQPKHMVKLFSNYNLPFDQQKWTVGAGLRWQSKTFDCRYSTCNKYSTQYSYTVADVMLRYQVNDALDATLNIDNIFNEKYHIDPTTHAYGATRNTMFTVRYKFL